MGASNPISVRRISGRLVKDPLDKSLALPFGGTELGLVKDNRYLPQHKYRAMQAMEFGEQVAEVVYCGQAALFTAVLREWDDDAVGAIFPDAAVGASGKASTYQAPATTFRAGTLMSSRSLALLFVPDDMDREDWIILYRALPKVDEAAALQLSIGKEAGTAVSFIGIPDAAGRTSFKGPRTDLTL